MSSCGWRLYEKSFPKHERRSLAAHKRAMNDERFHAKEFVENGALIAILYYWECERFVYVEHFAVNHEHRGGVVGSKIFADFIAEKGCDKAIVLEIEPPVDEMTNRRLNFYLRHGMVLNQNYYEHPSYSEVKFVHELKLMSYPCVLDDSEFEVFENFISDVVLQYVGV